MAENNKHISKENKKKFDKFLFEDDFYDPPVQTNTTENDTPNTAPEKEQPLTQEDLAQAESQGYTKGLADGKEQAFEDYNAELKKHTEKLTAALQDIDTARTEIAEDIKQKAFTLLEAIADTLLADARGHYPQDLLKPVIGVLDTLTQEQKQHLVIYTPPETKDFLTQTLLKNGNTKELTEETIQADNTLQTGDCIVEWADGGADLRRDTLKDDIIATLEKAAKPGNEEEKVPKENVSQNEEAQTKQKKAAEKQTEASLTDDENKNEMN